MLKGQKTRRWLTAGATLLLRPGIGSGVLRSACLSVCLFASVSLEPLNRSSRTYACGSPVAVARSSSGGIAIRYVIAVLWMTSRLAVVGRTAMRGSRRCRVWCLWMICCRWFECERNNDDRRRSYTTHVAGQRGKDFCPRSSRHGTALMSIVHHNVSINTALYHKMLTRHRVRYSNKQCRVSK